MDSVRCQICASFCSRTVALMVSHLVSVHSGDADVNLQCEVPNCQMMFTRVNSYKSHLRRVHSGINLDAPLSRNINIRGEAENNQEEVGVEPMEGAEAFLEPLVDPDCGAHSVEDCTEANRRQNALYLLKIKESLLLSQKALDEIVEGSTTLVRNTVKIMHAKVKECFGEAGNADFNAETPGLSDLFQENHPTFNPFSHVSTKSKQTAYFKENFGLIEPRRVVLGHRSKQRRSGTKYKEVLSADEVFYVPLLETLEQLLNEPSVLLEVTIK